MKKTIKTLKNSFIILLGFSLLFSLKGEATPLFHRLETEQCQIPYNSKLKQSLNSSSIARTGARYIVDEKKSFLVTFEDGTGLYFDSTHLFMIRSDRTTKKLPDGKFTRFFTIFHRANKITNFLQGKALETCLASTPSQITTAQIP